VGPFQLSFPSYLKPLVTVLIIAMQKKKCKKDDVLTFVNVLGEYFNSHENVDMCFKKRTCGGPT